MKAVILAAGRGSRILHKIYKPKFLIEIGEQTLLERHIALLKEAGVEDIYVVTGFKEGKLPNIWSKQIIKITNPMHAKFNNWYSLLLGLKEVSEDVLIINADVYLIENSYKHLAGEKFKGNIILAKPLELSKAREFDSTKISVNEGGTATRLNKMLHPDSAKFDAIGIYRISVDTLPYLRYELKLSHKNETFPKTINRLIQNGHEFNILENEKCYEIDTWEDLNEVKKVLKL